MRARLRRAAVALPLLLLALPAAGLADEGRPLEDASMHGDVLEDGSAVWRAHIVVPPEATSLTVAACSPRNVDLYLRHGAALGEDLAGEADVTGRGAEPMEVLRIERDGPVALVPGDWHVAVARPPGEDLGARFQVAVLMETAAGPRTVLPGSSATQTLPLRPGPELRTFLPRAARSLTLSVFGADEPEVGYVLLGPERSRRSGQAPRQLVLGADGPAGIYTLDLEASAAEAPDEVRVDASWSFSTDATTPAATAALPIVRPGSAVTLSLGGENQPTARSVRIPIPHGTAGFRVEAQNASGADVDLYVRRGRPMRLGDEDADYFALSSAPSERLVVGGTMPLAAATYHCEVVLVQGKGPADVTLQVDTYRGRRGRGTWGERLPRLLEPGSWTPGRVEAGLAGVTWYLIQAPARTRTIHAVLLGATAPLDLVLARAVDGSIIRRALTARVDERLDYRLPRPEAVARPFMLGVMNRNPYEERIGYRIGLQFDRSPSLPADLHWPPVIDHAGRPPSARVAAATVELTVRGNAGGSGTCVTPQGRILTCRHVLEVESGTGAIQRRGVLVAFTERLDAPPVQSYVAEVTHDDRERDLAMLRITADVFGRRLRADQALPWVPLGASERLELGDKLHVFGYPAEGSERTRTPIILTGGAVAGFESRQGRARWIKTDAWIGLGHSGGPVVDHAYTLVGIAAATLGSGDVLGLAIPLARVPASWRTEIRADQPR